MNGICSRVLHSLSYFVAGLARRIGCVIGTSIRRFPWLSIHAGWNRMTIGQGDLSIVAGRSLTAFTEHDMFVQGISQIFLCRPPLRASTNAAGRADSQNQNHGTRPPGLAVDAPAPGRAERRAGHRARR